jgi:hypothetical protein
MKTFYFVLVFSIFAICSSQVRQSIIQGEKDIAVTIYNNDIGVVKDTRTITFAGGISELNFTDVASTIIPETVTFDALGTVVSISVL